MNFAWIGAALALLAAMLCWAAVATLRRGRVLSGVGTGALAMILGAAAGLSLGMAAAFTAVDRLSAENDLGSVDISAIEPGVYTVTLDLANQGRKHYRLAGDHWQIDVRFLRWQLPARLAGADSVYQLDRLSGRYAETADLAHAEITAYSLADAPGRLMWRLATQAGRWLPWVDAEYGVAVFMPMVDGARYRVAVTDSGLVARADNPAAREAAARW